MLDSWCEACFFRLFALPIQSQKNVSISLELCEQILVANQFQLLFSLCNIFVELNTFGSFFVLHHYIVKVQE